MDSFGTEEFFNHPSKAEKSGFRNPWGRLDLNLKQFWTFYPHNEPGFENTQKGAIPWHFKASIMESNFIILEYFKTLYQGE